MIDYYPELLAEVLLSSKSEEEFLTEIRSSTTAINQHFAQKIDFDQLKKLVLDSFEDQLKISLSAHESQLKDTLLKEKYSTNSWNLHRQKRVY